MVHLLLESWEIRFGFSPISTAALCFFNLLITIYNHNIVLELYSFATDNGNTK